MRRTPTRLLALSLAAALVGCAGSARIEISSLNFRSIDPPRPKTIRVDADACYWWTEPDGRVGVAMRRVYPAPLIPELQQTFRMSLMMEKLPAGRARNYEIGAEELRSVVVIGPFEGRFVSSTGIVALYREDGNRLRGSFRLLAARQARQLLGGFSSPARYVFQGDFVAFHDPQRGAAIAAETEAAGFARTASRWTQHDPEAAESQGLLPEKSTDEDATSDNPPP